MTEKLISGEFFYPEESGIKKFEFHRDCDDYSWYEFDSLKVVKGETCALNYFWNLKKLNQAFNRYK